MKLYSYKDEPIKVFGLVNFEENGKQLRRLPDELIEKMPNLSHLGKRCSGARMCFKTDSDEITVKMKLKTLSVDLGMSIFNVQSLFVFAGERTNSRYIGLAYPKSYEDKEISYTFKKGNSDIEDITVWLPRNEEVDELSVGISDEAKLLPPTPYKYSKPIVYYGSSITEGASCSNATTPYSAVISRHLDVDYYNLGFSGSAKGEPCMAEFIAGIKDMSIFVFDYDHNAPTAEHLRATHEPFFKIIREKNPNLPIIMMTRPAIRYGKGECERRDIVKASYENAKRKGDKNVWFIDGEKFYGKCDRDLCTLDLTHPNDLGAYRMASIIEPVIEKILKKQSK